MFFLFLTQGHEFFVFHMMIDEFLMHSSLVEGVIYKISKQMISFRDNNSQKDIIHMRTINISHPSAISHITINNLISIQ